MGQPLYCLVVQIPTDATLSGVSLIRPQWTFGIILRKFKDFCKRRINILTRHYETATGLETWFVLPDSKPVLPPPRWKMSIVVFVAAYTTSLLSRSILGHLLSEWPLIASSIIFTAILVVSLTYLLLPLLSQLLRRWLYPVQYVKPKVSENP